jgi:hypothetical protein
VSAPRVTRLRATPRTLNFRLSEPATVRLTVRRGSRTVSRITVHAHGGANAVPLRGLRPGRYQVFLAATDMYGNAARVARKVVRVGAD